MRGEVTGALEASCTHAGGVRDAGRCSGTVLAGSRGVVEGTRRVREQGQELRVGGREGAGGGSGGGGGEGGRVGHRCAAAAAGRLVLAAVAGAAMMLRGGGRPVGAVAVVPTTLVAIVASLVLALALPARVPGLPAVVGLGMGGVVAVGDVAAGAVAPTGHRRPAGELGEWAAGGADGVAVGASAACRGVGCCRLKAAALDGSHRG